MPLTNADYISQLDPTSPQGSDPKSQGDDYLRNIQKAVKQSFANVSGAVTADHTELNLLDGCTASTNRLNDVPIPNGTSMLFTQATAPTGWTQDITYNDRALRITSSTTLGGSLGGSVAFETAFASQSLTGTTDSTTVSGTTDDTTAGGTNAGIKLTANQSGMPSHSHTVAMESKGSAGTADGAPGKVNNVGDNGNANATAYALTNTKSATANSNHTHAFTGTAHSHSYDSGGHTHTFTGTAIDLDVKYINVIICTKDAVT